MANKNVFNRNVSQLDSIPRSLQRLEHRHTFDAGYGMIIPNFSEILYPNETLRLRTTNFLRSIPMKTPQLSRVRIFQRYIAVPLRILWQPWEDYINSMNPVEQIPTEPYICNFNALGGSMRNSSAMTFQRNANIASFSQAVAYDPAHVNLSDFSTVGIFASASSLGSRHRSLQASSGHNFKPTDFSGYQFFPHELGDYLNAPLFSFCVSSHDVTSRFSAFKFGAYQLAYNFFYRRPNVQDRTDDYYEMSRYFGDRFIPEYSPFYATIGSQSTEKLNPFVSYILDGISQGFGTQKGIFDSLNSIVLGSNLTNVASSTNSTDVALTSWRNCEKFVLRSGANMNLQAKVLDSDGDVTYQDSYISLTRMRYAPWMLDRFTSANPWPQRGTEAQIGVSGLSSVTTASGDATLFVVSPSINAGSADYAPSALQSTGSAITSGNKNLFVSGSGLYVSPSNFRFAMQLQHAKEKSGMTDGRYKSYMSMFFGSRLHSNQIDYPQFIGGFVQDLNVNEVEQTSESATTPLGTLAGRGVSARKGSTISFHATEHTVILGLFHIMPDAEYIGGLNRVDHTTNPFDWVLPDFAGLQEQPVRMSELACQSTTFDLSTRNDVVFGYEPRFNELRARHSYTTGAFRDVLNSLGSYEYYKPWLITRNFGFDATVNVGSAYPISLALNTPTLSSDFLSTRHTMDYSNFEITNLDVMYPFMVDSYHDETVARVIPRRGIPRI